MLNMNFFTGRANKKPAPTKPVGVSSAIVYNGYLQENEKNRKLVGREKYITWSDILSNNSTVAASVRYFLDLTKSAAARYSVVPADDSADADMVAEAFEAIFDAMDTPLDRVVTRAAMYRYYGFSMQEWTLARISDQIVGLKDISPRAQFTIERWDVEAHGALLGVVQRSPQNSQEIYIPRDRLLYMCDDSLNDGPEGLGLFRHITKPAEELEKFEDLEGIGYENSLRGMPVARLPLSEMAQDAETNPEKAPLNQQIMNAFSNLFKNHAKDPQRAMALDSAVYENVDGSPSSQRKYDLDVIKSGGEGEVEIAAAIVRKQREIARALGTESIMLGDGAGSRSLADSKDGELHKKVDGALTAINHQLKRDVMTPIMIKNGWDLSLMPEITFGKVTSMSVEQLAGMVERLARSGVMLTNEDEAVKELFTMAGLTPPTGMGLDLESPIDGVLTDDVDANDVEAQ